MRDAAFRTSRGATSHSSVFRSASETRRPSDLSSRRLLPPPRPIPSLSNTAHPRRLSPRAPPCIARPRAPSCTVAPFSPSAPQPRSSSPPPFWVAGGRRGPDPPSPSPDLRLPCRICLDAVFLRLGDMEPPSPFRRRWHGLLYWHSHARRHWPAALSAAASPPLLLAGPNGDGEVLLAGRRKRGLRWRGPFGRPSVLGGRHELQAGGRCRRRRQRHRGHQRRPQ